MKIIATISPKGGVGKSTLCYSLGKYFHDMGKKVLILDSDTNLSLFNCHEDRVRSAENGMIKELDFATVMTFAPPKTGLERLINSMGEGYDIVIVDTCGAITDFHTSLIYLCLLIFIPVTPNKSSIDSALGAAEYIEDAQTQNNGKPVYGLVKVNFDKAGVADKQYVRMLEAEDKPTFDTTLYTYGRRYKDAALYGLSITELDKVLPKAQAEASAKAAIQMRNFCKECYQIVEQINE